MCGLILGMPWDGKKPGDGNAQHYMRLAGRNVTMTQLAEAMTAP